MSFQISGGPTRHPETEKRLDDLKEILAASDKQTKWIIILAVITAIIGIIQILIMKGIM